MPSTEKSVTKSLLLQLELLWFSSCREKETGHWAGAESLKEGNAGCPFGAFKLQPWPVRTSWALVLAPEENAWCRLPWCTSCSERTLYPVVGVGTVWYSSCAHMQPWSWRPHGRVGQRWVPGDRPCPSARLFWWGWGGCDATGSGVSTVGAVPEIPAPRSRTRHRHASSHLHKCARVAGLLGRGRCVCVVFSRQM